MAAAFAAPDTASPCRRNRCAKFALCRLRSFPTMWRRSERSITKRATKRAGLGVTQFEMSAGLNDSPKFIQALSQIGARSVGAGSCRR